MNCYRFLNSGPPAEIQLRDGATVGAVVPQLRPVFFSFPDPILRSYWNQLFDTEWFDFDVDQINRTFIGLSKFPFSPTLPWQLHKLCMSLVEKRLNEPC